MENNSIPTANPNEGSDERPANGQTGEEGTEKTVQNLPSANGDVGARPEASLWVGGFIFLVIEAISWVFWQFADATNGNVCARLHWLSLSCLVLGPLPFAHRYLTRNGRFLLWGSYAFICVLLVPLTRMVWVSIPPKPNLLFAVSTTHAPGSVLQITNAFLQINGPRSELSPTGAVLAVATFQKEPKIGLLFELVNDPASAIEAEGVEVLVVLPDSTKAEMDKDWKEVVNQGASKMDTMQMRRFSIKFQQTLYPGEGEPLPMITLPSAQPSPTAQLGDLLPFGFIVRAKGSTLFNVGFWLYLLKMPEGDTTLVLPKMFSGGQSIFLTNDVLSIIPLPH